LSFIATDKHNRKCQRRTLYVSFRDLDWQVRRLKHTVYQCTRASQLIIDNLYLTSLFTCYGLGVLYAAMLFYFALIYIFS